MDAIEIIQLQGKIEHSHAWYSEFSQKFKYDWDMEPSSSDAEEYKKFICQKLGIDRIFRELVPTLLSSLRREYKFCFDWHPAFCLVEDAMKYHFSLQQKRWNRGDTSLWEIRQMFNIARETLAASLSEGEDSAYLKIYLKAKRIELAIFKIRHELSIEEEEQKRRIREEQKALKELKREKEQAEKDAAKAQAAIEKNKEALSKAKTSAQIEKLKTQIEELKIALQRAEERRERAISMAQQTRCGYVYIISNIGSFGEGVFKIGLTRRIDPMDRVRELGDASVPFPFDVHTFIYSEDAPALETALHRAFEDRKVNSANWRKEYFRVSLNEIRSEVERQGFFCEWVERPHASQWRSSQGKSDGEYEFNPFEEE